jgi:hypothetical protein
MVASISCTQPQQLPPACACACRKRDFPQQYSLQHLPHKKRVKHAAAAAGSYGGSFYSGDYGYDAAAAGMGGWEVAPEGAFQVSRVCLVFALMYAPRCSYCLLLSVLCPPKAC